MTTYHSVTIKRLFEKNSSEKLANKKFSTRRQVKRSLNKSSGEIYDAVCTSSSQGSHKSGDAYILGVTCVLCVSPMSVGTPDRSSLSEYAASMRSAMPGMGASIGVSGIRGKKR